MEGRGTVCEFRCGGWLRLRLLTACLAALLCVAVVLPAAASADGPVTPTATNFLARVTHAPSGIQTRIIDAYLNLWVKVPATAEVTVLDFEDAPWVRFTPAGVYVNHNSQEYYLSQIPVPAVPPAGLRRNTRPHWVKVSSGHSYVWREGRLHALATIALTPGQSYIGRWRIPVVIDGRTQTITGGLWHRGAPSILWFWPVLVLLACALAAWRVRSAALDRRLARALALVLLAFTALGMCGKYLHGSPGISAGSYVLAVITLLVLGAIAARLLRGRSGAPLLLLTAVIALWAGITLLPVLTHGYALVSIPLFLARTVSAALLGGALSLALFAMRALDTAATPSRA